MYSLIFGNEATGLPDEFLGEDKNGLTNVLKSTEDNQAVQSCKLVEGNPAQMWYFEPADTGKISDVPTDGKTYHIRVRHSGQYLDVDHKQTTAGTRVMQHYFNGGMNQQGQSWRRSHTEIVTDWLTVQLMRQARQCETSTMRRNV